MPALLFPNFQSFFLWIRDLSHTAKISNIFVWFICLLIFLIFSIQTLGDLFLFVFVFVLQRNLSLFSSVAPGFSRAARPVPAPRLRKQPPRWPLTCVYLSAVHADLPHGVRNGSSIICSPTLFHLKDASFPMRWASPCGGGGPPLHRSRLGARVLTAVFLELYPPALASIRRGCPAPRCPPSLSRAP